MLVSPISSLSCSILSSISCLLRPAPYMASWSLLDIRCTCNGALASIASGSSSSWFFLSGLSGSLIDSLIGLSSSWFFLVFLSGLSTWCFGLLPAWSHLAMTSSLSLLTSCLVAFLNRCDRGHCSVIMRARCRSRCCEDLMWRANASMSNLPPTMNLHEPK
jgi:hypothetical protein